MASQEVFRECYRGRQTALHHMSYMRMAKVLLTLSLLEKAGIRLEGKSLFDYGFGAGTFFRYCPSNTRLLGVEMDAQNVAGVREMVSRRGYKDVCLEAIDTATWERHPLLQQKHDVILCSHVLEHLPDPISYLRRIGECLGEGSVFVGLVPVNERKANPHHIQVVDEATIRRWAGESNLEVHCYLEGDHWGYWVQPLYTDDSALINKLGQLVSMALGIPATILGHRIWGALARLFALLTFSKPTQAAFVLAPKTNQKS